MKASGAAANFPFVRLFVAIDLDDVVRAMAVELQVRLGDAGVPARFELAEKLHLTLAFLGATAPERYEAVVDALRQAAAACAPFGVDLDRLGAFPNERRPRLYWLGASKPQPEYAALAAAVRAQFTALGYDFKSDAVPHVTLCRLKSPVALPQLRVPRMLKLAVRELVLYESLPAGPTTRYVARERAPLGASGRGN